MQPIKTQVLLADYCENKHVLVNRQISKMLINMRLYGPVLHQNAASQCATGFYTDDEEIHL